MQQNHREYLDRPSDERLIELAFTDIKCALYIINATGSESFMDNLLEAVKASAGSNHDEISMALRAVVSKQLGPILASKEVAAALQSPQFISSKIPYAIKILLPARIKALIAQIDQQLPLVKDTDDLISIISSLQTEQQAIAPAIEYGLPRIAQHLHNRRSGDQAISQTPNTNTYKAVVKSMLALVMLVCKTPLAPRAEKADTYQIYDLLQAKSTPSKVKRNLNLAIEQIEKRDFELKQVPSRGSPDCVALNLDSLPTFDNVQAAALSKPMAIATTTLSQQLAEIENRKAKLKTIKQAKILEIKEYNKDLNSLLGSLLSLGHDSSILDGITQDVLDIDAELKAIATEKQRLEQELEARNSTVTAGSKVLGELRRYLFSLEEEIENLHTSTIKAPRYFSFEGSAEENAQLLGEKIAEKLAIEQQIIAIRQRQSAIVIQKTVRGFLFKIKPSKQQAQEPKAPQRKQGVFTRFFPSTTSLFTKQTPTSLNYPAGHNRSSDSFSATKTNPVIALKQQQDLELQLTAYEI